eukprot:1366570-Pyramimonas_sp.AAC.1
MAFSHGFKKIHGLDACIDEIPHHGSTDQVLAVCTVCDSRHSYVQLVQLVRRSLSPKGKRMLFQPITFSEPSWVHSWSPPMC